MEGNINYVKSLIAQYENNFCEAINQNKFMYIEKYLLPGSDFYRSQKKLVETLNQRGIKENLEKYSIEKIVKDDKEDSYKAYVYEKITIIYPSGKKKTNEYYWIYTVSTYKMPKKLKVNSEIEYRLSNIEKWDRNKK